MLVGGSGGHVLATLVESEERALVEKHVTQPVIGIIEENILPRLARRDE